MKHILSNHQKGTFSHNNGICRLMEVWTVNQINQFPFVLSICSLYAQYIQPKFTSVYNGGCCVSGSVNNWSILIARQNRTCCVTDHAKGLEKRYWDQKSKGNVRKRKLFPTFHESKNASSKIVSFHYDLQILQNSRGRTIMCLAQCI